MYCNVVDCGSNLSYHRPITCSLNCTAVVHDTSSADSSRAVKNRWDRTDLDKYYYCSGYHLQLVPIPEDLLKCKGNCSCRDHINLIEVFYSSIIQALLRASAECVPRIPVNCLKPYWCDSLNHLKAISIDMHNLWRKVGSPRTGLINEARIRAKLDYKTAIKQARYSYETAFAAEIGDQYIAKDFKNFWKSWNNKFSKSSKQSACIGNEVNDSFIADKFMHFYQKVYVDSADDSDAVREYEMLYNNRLYDNVSHVEVDVATVEKCINLLRPLKACGHDNSSSEHLLQSSMYCDSS